MAHYWCFLDTYIHAALVKGARIGSRWLRLPTLISYLCSALLGGGESHHSLAVISTVYTLKKMTYANCPILNLYLIVSRHGLGQGIVAWRINWVIQLKCFPKTHHKWWRMTLTQAWTPCPPHRSTCLTNGWQCIIETHCCQRRSITSLFPLTSTRLTDSILSSLSLSQPDRAGASAAYP